MQRWLRGMAPALALRCRQPLWAGLRRGYILTKPHRQVRPYAHAVAVQSLPGDKNGTFDPLGISRLPSRLDPSLLTNWYAVRRDQERHGSLKDVTYYSNLQQYPTSEKYRDWSEELFARPPENGVFEPMLEHLRSQHCIIETKELLKQPDRLFWRYNITLDFNGVQRLILGEGGDLDSAYTAAFMGLLKELHITGLLEDTKSFALSAIPRRESRLAQSDIAAKLHIHNFAARYMVMPNTEVQAQEQGRYKASVTIPGTDFAATITTDVAIEAEFMAYAALKKIIELRFEREGRNQNLRDTDGLNLDNANLFLNFYKSTQTYNKFRREEKAIDVPDYGKWTSYRLSWADKPLGQKQTMPTAEAALQLATLDAAVSLASRQPELFQQFKEVLRDNRGQVPIRISPQFASLNGDVVATLEETVQTAKEVELNTFQLEQYQLGFKPFIGQGNRYYSGDFESTAQSISARNDELKTQQEYDCHDPHIVEKLKIRSRLPIYQHRTEILAMVKNHDQCIVVGTTGSGKSTQVPQIILDDAIAEGRGSQCNIVCTQPRRLAAVSLALSVCNERNREPGDMVGYAIAGDRTYSPNGGRIVYCTTEILAIQLERNEGDLIDKVSHIIVDEIHERSVNMDRLLSTIKLGFTQRMAAGQRVPKLVLMSATVESDLFERYFEMISEDGTVVRPPFLNIPGRRFNTETKFLESYESNLPSDMYGRKPDAVDKRFAPPSTTAFSSTNESAKKDDPRPIQWESASEQKEDLSAFSTRADTVAATIVHIANSTEDGSILAFIPGAGDIRQVRQQLLKQSKVNFSDPTRFRILMLHSSNPSDLAQIFDNSAPGVRRVILATNIAESSLTFPDVQYVVDSGMRRNAVDSSSEFIRILQDEQISRANVLQRAGRTGRTRAGIYYGTFRSKEMDALDVFPEGEVIDQFRLQNLYLRAKVHFPSIPVEQYFGSLLTAPSPIKIEAAKNRLQAIGALNENGDITTIGYFLYRTLLPPALARMVLLGFLFRCVDQAIILANILSIKFPVFGDAVFDTEMDAKSRETAQHFARNSGSDLLAQLRAYEQYISICSADPASAREWASKHGLMYQHLDFLHVRVRSVRRVLYKAGFFGAKTGIADANTEEGNTLLLKVLIFSALYPNVATHSSGPFFITHRSLVARPATYSVAMPGEYNVPGDRQKMHDAFSGSMYCYSTLFSGSGKKDLFYMGTLTPISPLMAALFSNKLSKREGWHNELMIDEMIPLKFSGDPAAASTFFEFKKVFDTMLVAGMQNVCEVWPRNQRKQLRMGMPDIVLQAALELLQYEEGQEKRRQGDVGKFNLGPDRQETVRRKLDVSQALEDASSPQPQSIYTQEHTRICRQCGQPGHIAANCTADLRCYRCGEMGHGADKCPNTESQARDDGRYKVYEDDTPVAWIPRGAPHDAPTKVDDAVDLPTPPWDFNPTLSEDDGFYDLPTDLDNDHRR